jgi:membrane associated rhomboid family serine protease
MFLILPVGVDKPPRRTPVVNYALVGINVAVFLLFFPRGPDAKRFEYIFALWPFDSGLFHVRQFLTSAFLHANWQHLTFNMLFLWAFGNSLNDRLGHVGYALFFLLGAAGSALGHLLVSSGEVPCVGASGAICAVVGGYLVLLPLNDVKMLYWFFIRIGTFFVRPLPIVAFWALSDLLMWQYGAPTRVAYAAHLSGYALGIGVTLLLIGTRLIHREGIDLLAWITGRLPDGRYWRTALIPVDSTTDQCVGVRGPGERFEHLNSPFSPTLGSVDTEQMLRDELVHAVAVGDTHLAIGLYEQYVVANPGAALPLRVLVTVGNWYLRMERYSEAVQTWRRAVSLYPDHHLVSNIRFSMGMTLSRHLGLVDAAAEQLRQSLSGLQNADRARIARREIARIERGAAG